MGRDALNPARLFMLGFRGETAPAWLERAIRRGLGGVILFDRNVDGTVQNVSSPAQLRRLTADLRDAAEGGLLVAVDQEGGRVRRLKETAGFSGGEFLRKTALELAGEGFEAGARAAAACAEMLADCGINLNFAPVVDLDAEPQCPVIGRYGRSFGVDPDTVCRHAALWIAAHHARGVLCCLKHFPGHGSARGDTHAGFVDASETWRPEELEPYRRLTAAGFDDAVMSAHLVVRPLDPSGAPATLSRPMLTGLLRENIGFQGLICTDDMQMGAIRDRWSYREAVQLAFLAGADCILVGNNLADQPDALEEGIAAVAELLRDGRIGEERLAASIARVERLQARAGRPDARGDAPDAARDRHATA